MAAWSTARRPAYHQWLSSCSTRAWNSSGFTHAVLPSGGVRRVRELPEQARDDERGLLPDVHRVVADALQATGDEDHVHRPLAPVGVLSDVQRDLEDLAV